MTLIAHAELKSQTGLNHLDYRNVPGLSLWVETDDRPVFLEAYLGLFVQTDVSGSPYAVEIQIVNFTDMIPLSWISVSYPEVTSGDVIVQTPILKALIPAGQDAKEYVVQIRTEGGNHYFAPAWQEASVPMFSAVEV